MVKRRAELVDSNGVGVATYNETCHEGGKTTATVRLHAAVHLTGTEELGIYAKGVAEPVITVEASDPAGTEIREFHGTSAVGCVAEGLEITLVQSPGGQLGTLLIILASGTIRNY